VASAKKKREIIIREAVRYLKELLKNNGYRKFKVSVDGKLLTVELFERPKDLDDPFMLEKLFYEKFKGGLMVVVEVRV